MAHNNGSQFEILLQEIYSVLVSNEQFTQVERNVQLPGLDGPRQIDVLITSQVAGMPLKTVVECRDHNRILDVTAIDAFQSKLVDVSANKGVLVSRKGFSGTAKKKAKRVGITLCTAADARNILSTLNQEIPVVLTELSAKVDRNRGHLVLKEAARFDSSALFTINDKWIPDLFRHEVVSGAFLCPIASGTFAWVPASLVAPFEIKDVTGATHEIDDLEFSISVTALHYFGYINDLPQAVALHNHTDNATSIFLKAEDLPLHKSLLLPYDSLEQIPKMNPMHLVSVTIPTVASSTTFGATNNATGERLNIASSSGGHAEA